MINAARNALQPHGFTAEGGADIVDITQRAKIESATGAEQSGVQVADAVAAVDEQPFLRQQRASAVGDVTARQLHVIAANHAAALHRSVLRREVHLRHHHGLTVEGGGLPPQDTVVEGGYLVCRKRHAELQPQRGLCAGGAVHQVAHLVEVGAQSVDIACSGLVQDVVTDVPGIKDGIAEEAVIFLRIQANTVKHVRRAQELIAVRVLAGRSTRGRARIDAEQFPQVAKQRRIELSQPVEFWVYGDEVRAVRIGGGDKIAIFAGRQRVVAVDASRKKVGAIGNGLTCSGVLPVRRGDRHRVRISQ